MAEDLAEPGSHPPRTKRDAVVEALRADILGGRLARGTRLQQAEIAERFRTSITPVREALRRLEAEGLLVGAPHQGLRVATADRGQLKATYVVRRLVEPYAMQRAASRISRRDVSQAERLLEEMLEAYERGDGDAVRASNQAFHFLFYDRCGIPELADEIRGLWQTFPWDLLLEGTDRTPASVAEHRGMLDAASDGDLVEVAAATERHLRSGFLALWERMTGSTAPDPFELDVD